MFTITLDRKIKVIEMAGEGPNAMDFEFLHALNLEFEPNDSFHGVVLVGNGRFFSAGLNIITYQRASQEEVRRGILELDSLLKCIMSFPGPVLAVMNGHAIGGGCILALACDYRIGVKGTYKVAINELALGVDLPPSALIAIRKSVPANHLVEVSTFGIFYNPDTAFSLGLMNEIQPERTAMKVAIERCQSLTKSLSAYQRLKERLIRPELEKIEGDKNFADEFVAQWFTKETQQKLSAAFQKLKKK